MLYVIKRESDNKYISKFTIVDYNLTEWTDNYEEASKLKMGYCKGFLKKFSDKDVFVEIQAD